MSSEMDHNCTKCEAMAEAQVEPTTEEESGSDIRPVVDESLYEQVRYRIQTLCSHSPGRVYSGVFVSDVERILFRDDFLLSPPEELKLPLNDPFSIAFQLVEIVDSDTSAQFTSERLLLNLPLSMLYHLCSSVRLYTSSFQDPNFTNLVKLFSEQKDSFNATTYNNLMLWHVTLEHFEKSFFPIWIQLFCSCLTAVEKNLDCHQLSFQVTYVCDYIKQQWEKLLRLRLRILDNHTQKNFVQLQN